nr:MAG TPA: hypothetical protein [Caudoviricetes sp.]
MVLISITVPGTPFIITVPFDLVAFLLNTLTSLHILSKYSTSAVSAKEFKNIYSKVFPIYSLLLYIMYLTILGGALWKK